MKLEVQIRGKKRSVELVREKDRFHCLLDGHPLQVDAMEVATATYSILLDGQSYEVRVHQAPDGLHITTRGEDFVAKVIDPRRLRGGRGAKFEAEGRQEIAAPMPGKVVRVLVKAGDAVEGGHGLLVVEAMKMQNEIKSPKSGKIERVLVSEGQNVNAGEPLLVVA
jgi:biotin carboxyl carrier protein